VAVFGAVTSATSPAGEFVADLRGLAAVGAALWGVALAIAATSVSRGRG
jgi:hypothetical protein